MDGEVLSLMEMEWGG